MSRLEPRDFVDAARDGLAEIRYRRAWRDPWRWRWVAFAGLVLAAAVAVLALAGGWRA